MLGPQGTRSMAAPPTAGRLYSSGALDPRGHVWHDCGAQPVDQCTLSTNCRNLGELLSSSRNSTANAVRP